MFWIIIVAGIVLYFVLKGRSDRPEVAGAPKRAMGSGHLEPVTFVCPYPKCGSCGAATDKMKQEWDGLRTVKWTCGYCGNAAGVQELKDEELPVSARRRLGLDQPPMQPGMQPGPGYGPGYGRPGGVGDMLTGIMIGSMLGGDHHHHHDRPDSNGDWGNSSSSDSGGGSWGDSGNESWGDSGDSGGGSDFGDSGGGDSGGSDW